MTDNHDPLAHLGLTPMQKLQLIARELARRNPDAAEALGEELVVASAIAKTPMQFGVSTRINGVTGQLEMRAGDLQGGYVEKRPDADYVEHKIDLDL